MSSVSAVIPESNWRDLGNLAKLAPNQRPSLFMGRVSDPTSYAEWALGCCCSRVSDRAIVNPYLRGLITNFSESLSQNAQIVTSKEFHVIQGAISALDKLAASAASSRLGSGIPTQSSDAAYDARELSFLFANMKRNLEDSAMKNEDFVAHVKGRFGKKVN